MIEITIKRILNVLVTITIITRSTTAVDPRHLKVKEKDISLTKYYCIIISIQKLKSIHKYILTIQQIFGFHELKGHGHAHLKIIESTFSFPKFVLACKK